MIRDFAREVRRISVVGTALLLFVASAVAAEYPIQWKYVPDTTLRDIVKKGYELKTYWHNNDWLIHTTDHSFTEIYLLQKGDSVYRCEEMNQYTKDGKEDVSSINCYELVQPYKP